MILEIMNEFSIDEESAKQEYENKKDSIKLKQETTNGNITYVSKYNEGIVLLLKVVNQNQLQVVVNKMNTTAYYNNILRSIILLTSTYHKVPIIINKSMFKLLEDFEDDVSENNVDITLGILNDMLEDNKGDDDNDSVSSFDSLADFDEEDFDEELTTTTEEEEEAHTSTYREDDITPSDYKNLEEIDLKRYITRFINNKLKDADKDLFIPKYSTSCPAVDKKMPVVITKVEKDRIDKEHPESYSGYLKSGTTDDLRNKNYYICPMVWCPISRVSITHEELKKNKGKCPEPYEETPISMHKEGIKKTEGSYYKYPYYMNKNLHPNDHKMVCCGYKQKSEVLFSEEEYTTEVGDDDVKDDRYIKRSSHIPLEEHRLSTLPNGLHILLNPNKDVDACSGLKNDQKNGCFLRRGLNDDTSLYNNQKFLQSIYKTINLPNVKSTKALIKHINDNITMFEYTFLNNGNTMKTFMKYDTSLFDEFRNYFRTNLDYAKKMNLRDVYEYLAENTILKGNDSYIERTVQREFLIYCSMVNFKNYLRDKNVIKEPEDILDLLKFDSINPKKIQYCIIDITEEENIMMLCSKYSSMPLDMSQQVLILLKFKNNYEQLVRYEPDMNKPFCGNDNGIKQLVNIYRNNCKQKSVSRLILRNLIDTHIHLVINYNIKLVGFYDTKSKEYISLPHQENADVFISRYPIRYVDTLNGPKTSKHKDLEKVDDYYSKQQPPPNKERLEEELKLFIGYVYLDNRVSKMNEFLEEQREYFDYMKQFIEKFNKKMELRKKYTLIRHKLNPLTDEEKVNDMTELLGKDNKFSEKLAFDLYTKGIQVIVNTIYEKPNLDDNKEYFFDKMDMLEDTVLSSYDKSNNPYKQYNNSSEDLVKFNSISNPIDVLDDKNYKINMTLISMVPKVMYEKMIRKTVMAVKSSIKDIYQYLLYKNEHPEKDVKIYKHIKDTEHTNFWINYEENFWKKNDYEWGIFEMVDLAKKMNSGLILLTKNKTSPMRNQLKIKNHFKILIDHPDKYILIYLNPDKKKLFSVIRKISGEHEFIISRSSLTPTMQNIITIRDSQNVEPTVKYLRELYKLI